MSNDKQHGEELRHHTEQGKDGAVIRNPTKEEVEQLEKANGVIGEPSKRPKKSNKPPTDGYDCAMKEKTSAFEPKSVEFFLPSNKLIEHSGVTPRGSIYLRRLTTVEESIIQNALIRDVMGDYGISKATKEPLTLSAFLMLLNDVINPCIRSDIDVKELMIIDKIPIIVKLVSMTYGKDLEVEFTCEECGKDHKHVVDLERDLIVNPVPSDWKLPRDITLTDSFDFPVDVSLGVPCIGDEDVFIGSTIDVLKQYETIVVDARGKKPDGTNITMKDLPDIVDNLGDDDKKKVKEFITEYSKFGCDLELRPFKLCVVEKGKKKPGEKRCRLADKEVSGVRLPLQSLLSRMM